MKKKLFFLTLLLAGTGIWLFASQGTDADKFVPEEIPAAGEEKVKLNKIARELVKSCQHRRWTELERAFAVTREERELALAETGEDSVKAGLALLKQHAFQMSPEKFQMSHLKRIAEKCFCGWRWTTIPSCVSPCLNKKESCTCLPSRRKNRKSCKPYGEWQSS